MAVKLIQGLNHQIPCCRWCHIPSPDLEDTGSQELVGDQKRTKVEIMRENHPSVRPSPRHDFPICGSGIPNPGPMLCLKAFPTKNLNP